MKLRGKLVLVVSAMIVPLVVGAVVSMNAVWRHMSVHALQEHVLYRMENGGREECEKSPETFGRSDAADPSALAQPPSAGHMQAAGLPAPRPEVFAYTSAFVSANPAAPVFPAALRAELEGGAASADDVVERDGKRVLQLGLRMPWRDGPCAVVLARQELRSDLRALHDLVVGSALVGIGLVVAVLLASGPAVARIRTLAAGVRRSTGARWASPVEERGSDEIADLARAFNAAAAEVRTHVDALERREKTLREFVSNTDHDLTVPLTVLLGQLAELQRRADAGEPVDGARLREAAQEADYMASLVRNLGVAARLEAGEPALSRGDVDLNALVERVVARHLPVARSSSVLLEFAVPEVAVHTQGDETLLEQAVGNLVHNAVRHNRAGGHVAITLEAPKESDRTFVLRVADDGPGLPATELERIATGGDDDAAARPRATGKGGLGLRIVRRVTERHGMKFNLRPRDGGGLVAEIVGTRSG